MKIFPSNVIHIGGDEVNFDLWRDNKKINQWVTENGFNGFAAAQVDFTNKISQYIDSKGRKMMGWNEILGKSVHDYHKEEDSDVKLSKNSIIHFWQGNISMINQAVENGYSIVNGHSSYAYLDYENISLERCYSFNPIPEGIKEEYHNRILGPQCQMWGEWIFLITDATKLMYPRIAVFAETGWTKNENKDYARFLINLQPLKRDWSRKGIVFGVY